MFKLYYQVLNSLVHLRTRKCVALLRVVSERCDAEERRYDLRWKSGTHVAVEGVQWGVDLAVGIKLILVVLCVLLLEIKYVFLLTVVLEVTLVDIGLVIVLQLILLGAADFLKLIKAPAAILFETLALGVDLFLNALN